MTGTILGRNSTGTVRVADISLYSEVVAYGRELAAPTDATLFARMNIGMVESCPTTVTGRLQFDLLSQVIYSSSTITQNILLSMHQLQSLILP